MSGREHWHIEAQERQVVVHRTVAYASKQAAENVIRRFARQATELGYEATCEGNGTVILGRVFKVVACTEYSVPG